MFEELKNRMVLNESKKIQNESLEMLVEDDEFLDDDIEAVIDDNSEDPTIEILVDKIPDDDVISNDDLENEMVIFEEIEDKLEDDGTGLENEISGFDVTKETSPFSFSDDDLNEDMSISSYLENDNLTVDDDITGDTQKEIKNQTSFDDSIHESISGFDVTKETSPFSFSDDDLDI